MTDLTDSQIAFLNHHNIPLSSVFDAAGMPKREYGKIMRELGLSVAIGVTPCGKANHSLRNRSGHCVQCNTSYLAYQSRFSEHGFVYVAGSILKKVLKIGLTQEPRQRMEALNREEYGGVYDWEAIYYAEVPNAGRVEFESQKLLRNFSLPLTYVSHGLTTHCHETFRCSCSEAIQAVEDVAEEIYQRWQGDIERFEFL